MNFEHFMQFGKNLKVSDIIESIQRSEERLNKKVNFSGSYKVLHDCIQFELADNYTNINGQRFPTADYVKEQARLNRTAGTHPRGQSE